MSKPIVQVSNVSRVYRDITALDGVSLTLEQDKIYGLLGRNGAGKTTLMSILTAQGFASSGEVRVFGEQPYENESVLSRICFIRESQKYPDDFKPMHAFKAAALFYKNWDQDFAAQLALEFALPMKRRIKKLSRGQLSAVGVIIGLASRAELTFFDEPYLGLDAVARQLFYDRLLTDYAQFPRTIVLSSHLIDEVANLLEHVIIIDNGRILVDDDAENIRGSAVTIAGIGAQVESFAAGRTVLHRESLGALLSLTLDGALSAAERREAQDLGLELRPVSLQQIVIRKTLDAGASLGNDSSLPKTQDPVTKKTRMGASR
ncbi:ABC-2 type transport system ATP-binding protein [Arthrobacter alpinus]|uniref:ABC-2 type transport system ATP-binding protein n=1 Tax=Arthrobacter alpinus TaxID=656366 RepID=A0A1H5EVE9_9MICC|nr:ABC transporter ATP-binding protein [Arthrobacter alpinus]SED95063.1 ABC-2 type transport system ATP-binding protein [Arthrobacter alpinus]